MSSATMPPNASPESIILGDARLHAGDDIVALEFDEDGRLWSVDEAGLLNRWNLDDGAADVTWQLSDMETLFTFSDNARLLVSASDDVSLWDTHSGDLLGAIPQENWVTALAVHPSKAVLATGDDDGMLCLWDGNQAEKLFESQRHKKAISALRFSPDGSQLAVAAEDKTISLWDVKKKKHLGDLVGHKDRIPALAWHCDGNVLVSAGWDTTARVWDVAKKEPIILLNSHATQVWSLAFSGDGKYLACADSTPGLHVWDFDKKKSLHVVKDRNAEFRCLAFEPSGTTVAASAMGSIYLWNAKTGKSIKRGDDAPARMSFAPDGERVALDGAGGLHVWTAATRKPVLSLQSEESIRVLAFHPNGKTIAGGGEEHLFLWDAKTGKTTKTMHGPKNPTTALAFTADGALMASGSQAETAVWLWRTENGEPILLIPDALDGCHVHDLAFHPDGRRIAAGGLDPVGESGTPIGAAAIWDIQDRCEVATFAGGVSCVTFTKDGKFLIVGDLDRSICLWEVESKQLARELPGHDDAVRAVQVSPDGKWLASGGDDGALRLWETTDWTQQAARQLSQPVMAVGFSADGKYLWTGDGNATCCRFATADLLG